MKLKDLSNLKGIFFHSKIYYFLICSPKVKKKDDGKHEETVPFLFLLRNDMYSKVQKSLDRCHWFVNCVSNADRAHCLTRLPGASPTSRLCFMECEVRDVALWSRNAHRSFPCLSCVFPATSRAPRSSLHS